MRRVSAWFATAACVAGLLLGALTRLEIDADIASVLPSADPVVNDARYVIREHPALDQVFVDLHLLREDRPLLLRCAALVEQRLRASGLFRSVGLPQSSDPLAKLYSDLVDRLPTLFSLDALERDVLPRMKRAFLVQHFSELRQGMLGLDGIGSARLLARDPLSLRDVVMARLGILRPGREATLDGRIPISADQRHALVVGAPGRPGSDTDQARRVLRLLGSIEAELNRLTTASGNHLVLTTVGGMRAALDNERVIRRDTQSALLLASAGIALLILLGFPRPHVGLLCFIPAIVGSAVSIFVYSIFNTRISAVALGFGGALISITVDHGLIYLLFYVGAHRDAGRKASRQLWSVGLLAALTTGCAFLLLPLAGFPLLTEVGLIAGVGVLASFLFIHLVFPLLLPEDGRAKGRPLLPLPRWLERIGRLPQVVVWSLVIVAVALGAVARPRFEVDLQAMNAVTAETREAEALFGRVWGSVSHKMFVVLEGPTQEAVQADADRLAALLDRARARGIIQGGFSPSQLFPGPARAEENLAAWRTFWTEGRRLELRQALERASEPVGFAPEAFSHFMEQTRSPQGQPMAVPRELWALLGVTIGRGRGNILVLAPVQVTTGGQAHELVRVARAHGFRVLDLEQFPRRLASLLARSFGLMLAVVGVGVILLLILLLLDWRLVLVALGPLGFSAACTLGTLTLLGRPLDLGALMLTIVVVGLGLDYGLYLIRSVQRSPSGGHDLHGAVRTAVFLSGGTTLMGFGSLALSGHPVLRSIGITLFLGLGYALLGALVLVPPLLRRILARRPSEALPVQAQGREHLRLMSRAYRNLSPHPRLFAHFKVRSDPMFPRLKSWLPTKGLLVDIGCGYGVPATWAMTLFPDLRVVGLEPEQERVLVAAYVFGGRGAAIRCAAPHLPLAPGKADAVLALDVVHYLDEDALRATLSSAARLLGSGGRLILRATVPQGGKTPIHRRIEQLRLRAIGRVPHYRSADAMCFAIADAGFASPEVVPGPDGREEMWFVAAVPSRGAEGAP